MKILITTAEKGVKYISLEDCYDINLLTTPLDDALERATTVITQIYEDWEDD